MNYICLRSPAKLNLFLKVLNKREDGYHNLITIFERIDLFDKIFLKLNKNGNIRIFCNNPDVPRGPKNLVYKAAQYLRQKFSISHGVDIKIQKNIPVAAGLGGGSSNAATVLLGLNRLWKLHLKPSELLFIAKTIGSDVAFFLHDFPWALGTQRGDDIKKLNIRTKLWHVLVVPRVKIYSRDVYAGLKRRFSVKLQKRVTNVLTHSALLKEGPSVSTLRIPNQKDTEDTNVLTKQMDNVNILIRQLQNDGFSLAGKGLSNDLEGPIIRIHPPLLRLKERLKSFKTKGVMISGSGPCVFAVISNREEAETLKTALLKEFKRVFVAKTLL